MTEIGKKRDQHFVNIQDCTGSALIALSTAISLGMEDQNEPIDYTQLMKYLCDTGKILSLVYSQENMPRKSFITPILDRDLKSTLESSVADKWLYGSKLTEQVKEAKTIEKAASVLKPSEKQAAKKSVAKISYQGNWRGPSSTSKWFRPVDGQFQRKQFTNFGYKQKATTSKTEQRFNVGPRRTNPSAPKK